MILILGAQGMLGGEFRRTFSRALGWDRAELDLAQAENLEERIRGLGEKVTAVINCAAYNNVDAAEQHKELAFAINAEAVGKIAAVCKKLDVPFLHFSTNYVFDGEKGEYREADQPNPLSIYAQSKFEGEKLLQKNCDKYYLIRTSVLFGHEAQSEFAKKSFIEIMLELSQKTGTIKAVNDEINSLTYVSDLAKTVELLITKKYPYGIYHVVNSGEASWYDLAKEIFSATDKKINLVPVPASEFPRPARRPKRAVLLNTKLPALRSWQAALHEFLKNNRTF
ncbi:MAG: dTDP-4-dehydrorhamnose reductase [Patescibacteria group bacterium]|nr:dTDP-4-dehydrorhamnose reductase [Patescibacteria group bacterium]